MLLQRRRACGIDFLQWQCNRRRLRFIPQISEGVYVRLSLRPRPGLSFWVASVHNSFRTLGFCSRIAGRTVSRRNLRAWEVPRAVTPWEEFWDGKWRDGSAGGTPTRQPARPFGFAQGKRRRYGSGATSSGDDGLRRRFLVVERRDASGHIDFDVSNESLDHSGFDDTVCSDRRLQRRV